MSKQERMFYSEMDRRLGRMEDTLLALELQHLEATVHQGVEGVGGSPSSSPTDNLRLQRLGEAIPRLAALMRQRLYWVSSFRYS
jgi:hypothetical protein